MQELSERLFSACKRMHDAVDQFYEDIHPDVSPTDSKDDIHHLCSDLKYYIRLELDYVKELIREENE